jgi:hypothetical protein
MPERNIKYTKFTENGSNWIRSSPVKGCDIWPLCLFVPVTASRRSDFFSTAGGSRNLLYFDKHLSDKRVCILTASIIVSLPEQFPVEGTVVNNTTSKKIVHLK